MVGCHWRILSRGAMWFYHRKMSLGLLWGNTLSGGIRPKSVRTYWARGHCRIANRWAADVASGGDCWGPENPSAWVQTEGICWRIWRVCGALHFTNYFLYFVYSNQDAIHYSTSTYSQCPLKLAPKPMPSYYCWHWGPGSCPRAFAPTVISTCSALSNPLLSNHPISMHH